MNRPPRVLVLCQLDGYANSLKPVQVARFLREHGCKVWMADTYTLSRAGRSGLLGRLPAPTPSRFALYLTEAAASVLLRHRRRRFLSYYALRADCLLRRRIVRAALPLDDFDLVICEEPYDAETLLSARKALTLYDCPTPWADELWYEGRLTRHQHHRLRDTEAALFDSVDRLAFHWDSYARYALAHYPISGRNLMTLNFGCTPSLERARFAEPPRIVYLGSLSSRFIDLPLLAELSRRYPHIDVYGGPPPDPSLGLNFRGYATPEVLNGYQMGLVTCTRDPLRRDGFSAKHLEYLAHGLPVLVPAWRRHLEELRGSVPYEEDTFLDTVASLAEESVWQGFSDAAYAQAQRLAWGETLRPLLSLLNGEGGEPGSA